MNGQAMHWSGASRTASTVNLHVETDELCVMLAREVPREITWAVNGNYSVLLDYKLAVTQNLKK